MQLTRNWTDLYSSVCASFEGRAGGHTWLVSSPPELAAPLPAALEALDGKGTVLLLVHDGTAPLLNALQEWQPRGVLVVAREALSGGPAVSLTEQIADAEGGLSYLDGGEFPAWRGTLEREGPTGENAAASAAASLGAPVNVTTPAEMLESLSEWLHATPHGW